MVISIYAFNLHFDISNLSNFWYIYIWLLESRTFCVTLVMSNYFFFWKSYMSYFGPWSILSVFLYKMWNLDWGLFGFAYEILIIPFIETVFIEKKLSFLHWTVFVVLFKVSWLYLCELVPEFSVLFHCFFFLTPETCCIGV